MNRIKEVSVIAFCLGLVGCSTTGQDNFSTEPGKGFGWKSMNETHQIIQREMGGFNASQPITPQPYVVSSANFEGIQRIPEQYLRIWIPPYQDMQGNLHEESSIQTVIKSGQWKLPNPSINEHRKA
jgi:hypothetical protein